MPRHLLLILLPIVVLSMAFAMADPFEGTKWKVKVAPDEDARAAGARDFDDVLVFQGGKFTATEFNKKHGFAPVDWEPDTRRGPIAKFAAEARSEKQGQAKWSGTITGPEMTGELTWTKPDGEVARYTFKGERAQR